MDFNIYYHKDSLDDLEGIKKKSISDSKIILNKIESILQHNPFPFGSTIKRLKNIQPPLYRLRINALQSYRVFYRIIGNSIYVLKIVPKKEVNKILNRYF